MNNDKKKVMNSFLKVLKFHNNEYFNDQDHFILYDNSCKRLHISKVHFYKGDWYSNRSLKFKMTTVLSINCNEVQNHQVSYFKVSGIIKKFQEPLHLGISWINGKNIRESGLPFYWNDINTINYGG